MAQKIYNIIVYIRTLQGKDPQYKIDNKLIPSGNDTFNYILLEPFGVSLQIVPWNYPISLFARSVAVSLVVGNTIVIANPGTGKTTTLSFKIISLLKNNVKPEDILCITYTEKAKKEMYDAIKKNSQGNIPDSIISKVNINTFHSFAYQYLLESGDSPGEILGNNILRFSILQSFQRHNVFNYGKDYLISDIVPKVENAIRYIKNFGITPDTIDVSNASASVFNAQSGGGN